MRIRALIVLFALVAPAAWAQDEDKPRLRGDFGVRYWLSTGETSRSHNAQSYDPALGNPTSVLTYENLDANTIELFFRESFKGSRWFLKGLIGYGAVNRGSFHDEDFSAGQVKFSDTTSSVTQGDIGYGHIDLGINEWRLREGRTRLGVFIGYGEWKEEVDAYGITDHLGFVGDEPRDTLVITNKVVWKSLRVGFAGSFHVSERSRLDIDVAFIPYSKVRNDDSHHLRQDPSDLGPVPNILIEGRGYGAQVDAEFRYEIARRTELGLGVRYWYLETSEANRSLPNRPDVPELPVTEFYSERFGAMLSLRRTW